MLTIILQIINVLRDSFRIKMKVLHTIMERKNVEGVQTPTYGLYIVDEVHREDLSVKRDGDIQFVDPCILNNSENKTLGVTLRCFVGLEIGEIVLVLCLQASSVCRLCVFVDCRVVYARASGAQELKSICIHVVGIVQDEAEKILLAIIFIIRDDYEDLDKGLPDTGDVLINSLDIDELELIKRLSEKGRYFFRRHVKSKIPPLEYCGSEYMCRLI